MKKDRSRPRPGSGPATNIDYHILAGCFVEKRVSDEARAIAEARETKAARLAALDLEPPAAFDFEVSRRLTQWNRMICEYGRSA